VPVPLLGPGTGHMLVLGAALLTAFYGLLPWREFRDASVRVRSLGAAMMALMAAGLALILLAAPLGR
jgi:hypothetical protein